MFDHEVHGFLALAIELVFACVSTLFGASFVVGVVAVEVVACRCDCCRCGRAASCGRAFGCLLGT